MTTERVGHLAEIERAWFRRVVNGEDLPLVWSDERDFGHYGHADFPREAIDGTVGA